MPTSVSSLSSHELQRTFVTEEEYDDDDDDDDEYNEDDDESDEHTENRGYTSNATIMSDADEKILRPRSSSKTSSKATTVTVASSVVTGGLTWNELEVKLLSEGLLSEGEESDDDDVEHNNDGVRRRPDGVNRVGIGDGGTDKGREERRRMEPTGSLSADGSSSHGGRQYGDSPLLQRLAALTGEDNEALENDRRKRRSIEERGKTARSKKVSYNDCIYNCSGLRESCGLIVNDTRIQTTILLMIIINGLFMGIATFDFVTDDPENLKIFEVIDTLFLVLFTIELAMHLIHRGRTSIYDEWLVFDFTVVILSWAFEAVQVVRAFRIFRTFRLVARVKEIRNVVVALFNLVPHVAGISLLLLLIFYIFGVLFTTLFSEFELSEGYFVRLDASFFTLLQFMTMDFGSVTRECMEIHYWSWIPITIFVCISGFIVFNLIVAIICDAVAVEAEGGINNDKRRTKKQRRQKDNKRRKNTTNKRRKDVHKTGDRRKGKGRTNTKARPNQKYTQQSVEEAQFENNYRHGNFRDVALSDSQERLNALREKMEIITKRQHKIQRSLEDVSKQLDAVS